MSQRRIKATRSEIRPHLGATGTFPRGHLSEHDEGEMRFAVAADPRTRTILVEFGTPVAWLAFPPAQARELAATLLEKAKELEALMTKGLPS